VSSSGSGIPAAPAPSALVAGKYRLTSLLGRGGMGSVWAGVHATLGTKVAVKFIDAEHVDSAEARRRFENEARAAAALRSKHVVEVYDHGVMDDGRPFIVMEFLDGEPLDRRLDRLGRLPPKDTARIVQMVCRALAKAHAAGIVHRDLKPENVFLVWDDEDGADVAKVVDFGIAKFTEPAGTASSATRTGSVLGTPYYMSPEQARGLRSVDHRSDLWSVGVIAFRCMTGHLPFEGEAVGDVLVKLCTAPMPRPSLLAPDLPPAFDAWLLHALEREPRARFQSAADLARSLAAVCGLTPLITSSAEQLALGTLPRLSPIPGEQPLPHPAPNSPFAATTPSPALTPATVQTGAPITQTPAPSAKPTKSALLPAVLAAFALLGSGLGLAIRGFAKNTPVASGAAELGSVAAPSTPPRAAPSPAPTLIEVAPRTASSTVPAPPPAIAATSLASVAASRATPLRVSAPHRAPTIQGPKPKPASSGTTPKPVNDIGF
jgi:serine/threonine-protein kinase